jgi:hypothetical protein
MAHQDSFTTSMPISVTARGPGSITVHEPPPIPNARPAIQDLVMADVAERKAQGIAKYGTPLQPFNGRDALVDAYQEALDLCQYLRQAIYERDGR